MKLIEQVKDTAGKVVTLGTTQVEHLRRERRRKSLLVDLGEMTYRSKIGQVVDGNDLDDVVSELEELDARALVADVAEATTDENEEILAPV